MAQSELRQWIRLRRLQANLNQTQLGAEFDIHQVTISNWETGKSEPSPQDLRALEAFFRSSAPLGGAANSPQREATAPAPTTNSLTVAPPPKRKTSKAGMKTADFRHEGEKRMNIPTAKIAGEGRIPKVPKARYSYDPHLPPVLRFDETGRADTLADRIDHLIEKAGFETLTGGEPSEIREALRHRQPWLEWAGKREQHQEGWFEVDPVALHIHERVSAQAILRAARRQDLQRDLFADPQLPYQEAVQFYRHNVDWTNRMILGDSLQVMNSLAKREGLAGKVQMIYMDPPYGVKFSGNFQPKIRLTRSAESARSLSREAEMVRAYRDTWHLGVHSYLAHLRDRLLVARELLADSGSLFLQIGDENVHRVRTLIDEVFGAANFLSLIPFGKTSGATSSQLAATCDYILWFAKDKVMSVGKYRQIFVKTEPIPNIRERYVCVETPRGDVVDLSLKQKQNPLLRPEGRILRLRPTDSQGATDDSMRPVDADGKVYFPPGGRHWSVTSEEMRTVVKSGRTFGLGNSLTWKFYREPNYKQVTNDWMDLKKSGFGAAQIYVVQTASRVVERCLLMTTDPGDLVLDMTCGSGTTAHVAEQWGRRWITIDTSRVAIAIARQRLLTAKYDHYATAQQDSGNGHANPGVGFRYTTFPRVTLKAIAQNSHLGAILERHEPILRERLTAANEALARVGDTLRGALATKLRDKERLEGRKAITEADRRRWLLPPESRDRSAASKTRATVDLDIHGWYEWEVPFDTDSDWPEELQQAVRDFRQATRDKTEEVNACIDVNAPQEELVDQPDVVKAVLRVSGPFTVEGVMPAEFRLDEGLLGGAAEELDSAELSSNETREVADARAAELWNASAFLHRMVQLVRADGVTFLNNQHRSFARIEPLFEDGTGSAIHAEALWDTVDEANPNNVAIAFGPQYGPVSAKQVEELIRASRRYDELVIAGFSFDGAATAIIQEQGHPRLAIHQAHIRPDINPAMDGLLQDPKKSKKRRTSKGAGGISASSHQLFTVFGLPDIEVRGLNGSSGELVCELLGVDIYDPISGELKSTGASTVAAWFLDSDYDGRCFCITQAFFPNQNAWVKIQKALKTSADPEAFEAFNGTTSLPFRPGRHRRIAVKVIDPRGNEVITIHTLES